MKNNDIIIRREEEKDYRETETLSARRSGTCILTPNFISLRIKPRRVRAI